MPAAARTRPGDVAPAFTLTTLDGDKIASDALRGQVVVLSYWASWCAPCRQELPLLDAFARIHATQGLRVFAISTEESLPLYRLKPVAATLAFPLVRHVNGRGLGPLSGLPTNYVIDRRGVVRYAAAGAFETADLDRVLLPLIAEPAP